MMAAFREGTTSQPPPEDDRLERHLENWARFMRTGGLWVRRRTPVFAGAGPHLEDMEDDADLHSAILVDAIIRDLTHAEQCALQHEYLAAVWRFRDYVATLASAKAAVLMGINSKGLA